METVEALTSFMSRVSVSADCWEWTGSINGSGYGTFQDGSPKGVGAHRFSYETFYGNAPKVVRHTCRNRRCVKPTHLLGGTQTDNMRDKFFDKSGNTQKLTRQDVLDIRRDFVRYNQRRSNAKELAAKYGLHPKYLVRVAEGKKLSYVS